MQNTKRIYKAKYDFIFLLIGLALLKKSAPSFSLGATFKIVIPEKSGI